MPKVTGNSNCTPKQRCGNCTRDVQAAIKRRIDAARAASMQLDDNQRVCCDCEQVRPVDLFPTAGQHRHRFRCVDCDRVCRTIWNTHRKKSPSHVERPRNKKHSCIDGCGVAVGRKDTRCWQCYNKVRAVTQPVAKPATPRKFVCIGGCGLGVTKADVRCIPCKRERQVMIAASSEQKIKIKRAMSSLKTGSTFGVMFIGDEALSLSNRCAYCQKPILVTGLCYKHATGRDITLTVRPRIVFDHNDIKLPPALEVQ